MSLKILILFLFFCPRLFRIFQGFFVKLFRQLILIRAVIEFVNVFDLKLILVLTLMLFVFFLGLLTQPSAENPEQAEACDRANNNAYDSSCA